MTAKLNMLSLSIVAITLLSSTTAAYTLNIKTAASTATCQLQPKSSAGTSRLFSALPTRNRNFFSRGSISLSAGAEDEDEATDAEENDKTLPITVESKGTESGFKNAILMGPPLLFKFCIVLVVKFLTDIVVFPLLFLYRFVRLTKAKVLSVFGKDGEGEESSI
mmetsp:Transcript_42038/g.61674  ORF Transcript_42038/g.61674 Transcript_42038/m.61674 type:complete len:164 (+) Transcript_42038:39-530(+)